MELITVASAGNVMITNAAVSPSGRLFGNFPRWTAVPTPSVGDDRISGPNEASIGPDGCYDFPNSQAPRINRPYEVFKIQL